MKGLETYPIDIFTENELDIIKKSLTIENPKYESALKYAYRKPSEDTRYIKYYYISNTNTNTLISIPRNTLKTLGITIETSIKECLSEDADIKFIGDLRDYQKEFFSANSGNFEKNNDVILQMGCGTGKTCFSLYLAHLLQKKTLVFVPTNYLLKQWLKRISQFGNDAISISNTISLDVLDNYKIYIITYDMFTVLNSNVLEYLYARIGLAIFDELHRTGAETYLPILENLPTERRIGLTATFRRSDSMHKILLHHFGGLFTLKRTLPKATMYPFYTGTKIDTLIPKKELQEYDKFMELLKSKGIKYSETESYINFINDFSLDNKTLFNKKDYKLYSNSINIASTSRIDSFVAEDKGRILMYIKLIRNCLESGRTVLVLSKRKNILQKFFKIFKDSYKTSLVISETNKITDEEREKMESESQLILGIVQIAMEGLDIDRLDTLIYFHPIIDVEQPNGRITRIREGKKSPISFYPVDNSFVYKNMLKKSITFAKETAEVSTTVYPKDLPSLL